MAKNAKSKFIAKLMKSNPDLDDMTISLLEDLEYTQEQLDNLVGLPLIVVNPKNKEQQKETPAFKIMNKLEAQKVLLIKTIKGILDAQGQAEDGGAIQKWLENYNDDN